MPIKIRHRQVPTFIHSSRVEDCGLINTLHYQVLQLVHQQQHVIFICTSTVKLHNII